MKRRWIEWLDVLAILCLWAAALALIHPRGNFPLDDDWDFALATWRFAKSGHFQFSQFTAMSLRAQVLWGALWTRLFGQSFEVLRSSTLLLSAGTIALVHRTIGHAGGNRMACAAGALAIGFHPLFIWASCTYMTEGPFVFASALALYFFVRAFTAQRSLFFFLGCAAVILSWFVRQTGVTHAMAILALLLLLRGKITPHWRSWAIGASALLILFTILLIFRRDWLSGAPVEFAAHFRMWRESSFRLPQQMEVALDYGDFSARYSALFFLPLVAPLSFFFPGRSDRTAWVVTAVAAIPLLVRAQSLLARGLPLPYYVSPYCCDIVPGAFIDIGLGPIGLNTNFEYPFRLAFSGRVALTYLSVILGALLIGFLISIAARRRNVGIMISLSFAFFGSLGLLGHSLYVDRYVLDSAWPIAVALALALPWEQARVRWCFAAVLLFVAMFDVAALHDYFTLNRARWRAVSELRARGIPVQKINGGPEVFAFYEMAYMDRHTQRRFIFGAPLRPYTISFVPLDGYVIESETPLRSWVTGGRGRILVLRAIGTSG